MSIEAVAAIDRATATRMRLEQQLYDAERKANRALAGYKFQMFGYWAAIWVHLNQIGQFNMANPWKDLVHLARKKRC